jgi:hypothetical protein
MSNSGRRVQRLEMTTWNTIHHGVQNMSFQTLDDKASNPNTIIIFRFRGKLGIGPEASPACASIPGIRGRCQSSDSNPDCPPKRSGFYKSPWLSRPLDSTPVNALKTDIIFRKIRFSSHTHTSAPTVVFGANRHRQRGLVLPQTAVP